MAIELDHVFICTAIGAPAADRLTQFGLTEGPSNVHPGQGTANRRFFFHNAYLELLWVHDPIEAQGDTARSTSLWDRWVGRESGACPFGLCFRATEADSKPPFATWDYRAQYLPPPLSIAIAINVQNVGEPFFCHLPFAQPLDRLAASKSPPRKHVAGMRQITGVELVTPHRGSHSPELTAVINLGLVKMRTGAEHLLELIFDGESQRQRADFRPGLPLLFRW